MKRLRGSITVEAAFVMGMVLLVLLWLMKAAIGLYLETVDLTLEHQAVWEDTAAVFRKLFFAGELLP